MDNREIAVPNAEVLEALTVAYRKAGVPDDDIPAKVEAALPDARIRSDGECVIWSRELRDYSTVQTVEFFAAKAPAAPAPRPKTRDEITAEHVASRKAKPAVNHDAPLHTLSTADYIARRKAGAR